MFAVVFEVGPRAGAFDTYLGFAKYLKPELQQIDGFIDNERFASRLNTGRVLSLSTWRDEKALVRWRTNARHHDVQAQGRSEVFADYHLRVGEIVTDTQMPPGCTLRQERFDVTTQGCSWLSLTEILPREQQTRLPDVAPLAAHGVVDAENYESITSPGKMLMVASWWDETSLGKLVLERSGDSIRTRTVRVIRDYGMFSRNEAPQYYPPAVGGAGSDQAPFPRDT